jgi:hypothetical protein
MEKIKAYTTIEQSKKLAEILPLESADMYIYKNIFFGALSCFNGTTQVGEYVKLTDKENKAYPCWSLAVLLQVLPLGLYDELDDRDYELEINMIDKMPRYVRLGDVYHSQFPYDFEKDTLLDNVVESIIWLNNNNYFEL